MPDLQWHTGKRVQGCKLYSFDKCKFCPLGRFDHVTSLQGHTQGGQGGSAPPPRPVKVFAKTLGHN